MIYKSEKNKIVIVVILLLVLLGGIFVIRAKKKPVTYDEKTISNENTRILPKEEKEDNIIYLTSDKTNLETGETLKVKVSFTAPGKKIFGSDIILLYDPEYLSTDLKSIANGNFFGTTLRTTIDQLNGIIKLSAYDGNKEALDLASYDIMEIDFEALKKGQTQISLSFEKGKTNTSNLVEAITSQNILEKTQGLSVSIDD